MLSTTSLLATAWLTPLWLTSVGISVGLVLIGLFLLKVWIKSKIPGLNQIGENPGIRLVVGLICGGLFSWLFLYSYQWRFKTDGMLDESSGLALVFVFPLAAFLGWAYCGMITKKRSTETFGLVSEGFLLWYGMIGLVMLAIAGIGYAASMDIGFSPYKPVEDCNGMLASIGRLPYAGVKENSWVVAPSRGDSFTGDEFPVGLEGEEIFSVEIQSDQKIEIGAQPITMAMQRIYSLDASTEWTRFVRQPDGNGRIPNEPLDNVYIVNLGASDARVNVKWNVEPLYKEVWIVPWAAFYTFLIYVLYLSFASSFPKVGAIALSTFKTEMSQPLYIIVMLAGLVFLAGSIWIPYNTFGEDIKMYKDSGLTLIRVLAIFVAIWAAGKSVAEEIEGRTALTVLSKPVGRRQFIFGKYVGICLAIAVMFIVLGIWFEMWTGYKPVYDGRESSRSDIPWEECFVEATRMTPALALTFLEVTIFVAVSLAISTRFGILVNFLLCFAIYVLGHLTPLIVNSSAAVETFAPVVLFGQVIAVVFPVLDHFDVQAAINTNNDVPMEYLGWSVIYTMVYGTMAMLLALVFFEDRDLA